MNFGSLNDEDVIKCGEEFFMVGCEIFFCINLSILCILKALNNLNSEDFLNNFNFLNRL